MHIQWKLLIHVLWIAGVITIVALLSASISIVVVDRSRGSSFKGVLTLPRSVVDFGRPVSSFVITQISLRIPIPTKPRTEFISDSTECVFFAVLPPRAYMTGPNQAGFQWSLCIAVSQSCRRFDNNAVAVAGRDSIVRCVWGSDRLIATQTSKQVTSYLPYTTDPTVRSVYVTVRSTDTIMLVVAETTDGLFLSALIPPGSPSGTTLSGCGAIIKNVMVDGITMAINSPADGVAIFGHPLYNACVNATNEVPTACDSGTIVPAVFVHLDSCHTIIKLELNELAPTIVLPLNFLLAGQTRLEAVNGRRTSCLIVAALTLIVEDPQPTLVLLFSHPATVVFGDESVLRVDCRMSPVVRVAQTLPVYNEQFPWISVFVLASQSQQLPAVVTPPLSHAAWVLRAFPSGLADVIREPRALPLGTTGVTLTALEDGYSTDPPLSLDSTVQAMEAPTGTDTVICDPIQITTIVVPSPFVRVMTSPVRGSNVPFRSGLRDVVTWGLLSDSNFPVIVAQPAYFRKTGGLILNVSQPVTPTFNRFYPDTPLCVANYSYPVEIISVAALPSWLVYPGSCDPILTDIVCTTIRCVALSENTDLVYNGVMFDKTLVSLLSTGYNLRLSINRE